MPRPSRRPLASNAPDIDRKEIERRAREAATPAPTEVKGRWPFAPKDAAKDDSPRSANPDDSQLVKSGVTHRTP
jgi:hypothetical protein